MSTLENANFLLILVGAIIMLIGIIRAKDPMKYVPFVPENHREHIKRSLLLHRCLMAFFFCGYLVVLASFALHYHIASETFVSVIFLSGAVYVFIGISVQSRLLAEVQNTLTGILPICSRCKKIRAADGGPDDKQAWKQIEEYISQQSDVNFSHGLCPGCYEEEMNKINAGSDRAGSSD